jgi:hypothetical protein
MALVPANYAGLILTHSGWFGPQAAQMANGIAVGVTSYLVSHPSQIIVTVDAGAPGAGVGNGFLLPPTASPATLFGLLEASLRGQGLVGPSLSQLTAGLAAATPTYLATAQTITAHSSVGAGTGVGSFIGIEPVGMAAAITSVTGFVGPQWPQIVSGISSALVTFLTTNVKFTVVIAGPAGPGAASGAGFGRIL